MIVTDTLFNLLEQHVQQHGAVVWYDPGEVYGGFVEQLQPDKVGGAAVYRYTAGQGFMALRRELEESWGWERKQAPKLIIYVPLARANTGHALVEFEVAGVVLQPGQQPPERNTALAAVARRALPQVFPSARVEELVAQVEAGQLSLAELDDLAEKGREGQSGVIVTLFGTGNAPDVALRFLSDSAIDQAINDRNAGGSLAALLSEALGVPLSAEQGLPALRRQLARQLLLTDFIVSLGEDVPQKLQTVALAERPVARQAAVQLAEQWRNRLDYVESYCHFSKQIEAEIGLGGLDIPLKGLAGVQTFAAAETRLQEAVEKGLVQKVTAGLVELTKTRLSGFWSGQEPGIKTRWEVVYAAGRVLLAATRIDSALKGKPWPAETLVARYVYGDEANEPWCLLDTAQRHLERDFHRFELEPPLHKSLLQLVSHARQQYTETTGTLTGRFIRAYQEAKFELPSLTPQTDIFHRNVSTAGGNTRTAYLLVDALRYEMALELKTFLDPDWGHDLRPALATPPTITEVGMAALMPGAEKGLQITAAGNQNKLTPRVDGTPLRTRQERVNYFEKNTAGQVVTAKLQDLAPLNTASSLRKKLAAAGTVLVTATEEIDGLCESNPTLARRMLDDVFNQIRRGIKTLFGLGIGRVVITADHGYLFGEEISSGQTIDAPGGQTVALKRRVWVGKGGAHIPGTLRQPLSAFGIGGDLELVTPTSLAIFKVPGGATSYFHGGLSLPELVIPVLAVTSGATQPAETAGQMAWELKLGSPSISTRFLSVTVSGRSTFLMPLEPRAVRVEVRAGNQIISVPVSATDGFQEVTRDVVLQSDEDNRMLYVPNTVTLQITDEPEVETVTVHLLDATTGASLQQLEQVPFEIAF